MGLHHLWRPTPALLQCSLLGCGVGMVGTVLWFLRDDLLAHVGFVQGHRHLGLLGMLARFGTEICGFVLHDRWHRRRGRSPGTGVARVVPSSRGRQRVAWMLR